MVRPEDIKGWIETNLNGAEVEISGDGHHFEAEIICAGFAGKSRVQQHQMVYSALGDRMKTQIHALSMQTLTPEEKAAQTGS
ncbi:MAG: BolA family transcriptional regulator [Acidiferrobacteraceae bacterium]|jgi:acid stress-induced BolA-like protein IbaG/YrbA|nr:BolA family transcriptional regulator [Acidiferrobacteraceae bacterium]MCP4828913.1 BolA/IbaG family iron-sulfur metabolism protein [Pseudomonadota bacterium]MDP6950802.1 BolA/IbaG family iron-sulfur metabolism protein [Arenicellales bacterium]HJP06000.1 BolA/IbaG family iron-sulfur metabolism protein [Arenicellales bacterium]|tara:strand:- start:803 stop:1048 length:246 start_codon:yes stop_codon:yes gene_type:complete